MLFPIYHSEKIARIMSHTSRHEVKGFSVGFTGMMSRPRETCHEIARAEGLSIRDSVTKSLDILVVADVNTESSKARKARQYSIRIVNESAFFELIGA